MLRIIVICLLVFCSVKLFSQKNNVLKIERDSLWTFVQYPQTIQNNNKDKIFKIFDKIYLNSVKLQDEDFQLKILLKELAYRINTQSLDGFEDKLIEGVRLAKKQNDYVNMAKVFSYKSWYFSQLGYFDKAKEALKESENYAGKIQDKDVKYGRLHTIYLAHSIISENKKMPSDSIICYVKKAYRYALERNSSLDDRNMQVANAAIILATPEYNKNLESATEYLKVAENALSKTRDKAMFTQVYKAYARIESAKGNFRKSIEYCNKGIKSSKEFDQYGELVEFNMLMSDNYKSLNDYKNATIYSDRYIKLSDSLNSIQRDVQVNSKITKYSSDKFDVNSVSGFFRNYLYLILSVLSLIVAYFSYTILRNKKPFSEDNKPSVEKEILKKNGELELQNLVALARTDEHSFYLKFAEVYPCFNDCVKEKGNLNPSEIKLCNYLKLNFDTKQIALYTNSSAKAIESKKYRLRKKFNLEPQEDLYAFISKNCMS